MKRYLSLLLCVGITLGTVGCANRISTTPPSAAQAAAIGIDDFAALASAAQDTEISLYKAGKIDYDTHMAISAAFKRTGQSIQALSRGVTAGTSSATLSARIDAITTEVNTDLANSVLGVKNPESKAQLQALVKALGATAANLTALYVPKPISMLGDIHYTGGQ